MIENFVESKKLCNVEPLSLASDNEFRNAIFVIQSCNNNYLKMETEGRQNENCEMGEIGKDKLTL